ncbi:MAG: hypothetical protein ACJAZ8_000889 [Planctomycetota bacterium]
MVELEQAAETLATLDRPSARSYFGIDKFIADTLMVPLVDEVMQALISSAAQVAFAEQDHLAEAFLLDRSDETFGIGVGIQRAVGVLMSLIPAASITSLKRRR